MTTVNDDNSLLQELHGSPRFRPLKAFEIEMWLHYATAGLVLAIYLAGWISETITPHGVALSVGAGCAMALVLMRGYKIYELNEDGHKKQVASIKRWSVILRSIYLLSRGAAIALYHTPWPGVARLGGSVVIAIVTFQVIQGIYLQIMLATSQGAGVV